MKEQKCFEVLTCNGINLLFLHLCVKSELEEQRSHKVVTVKSIEFDLLVLVSLQSYKPVSDRTFERYLRFYSLKDVNPYNVTPLFLQHKSLSHFCREPTIKNNQFLKKKA